MNNTSNTSRPILPSWLFSVRTRFAAMTSFLIVLISIFIYWYFPTQLERNAMLAIAEKANSITTIMAYNMRVALENDDHPTVCAVVIGAKRNSDLDYVVVLDDSNHVVATFDSSRAESVKFADADFADRISGDGMVYQTAMPIIAQQKLLGRLYVGLSLRSLNAEITRSRSTIAAVSLGISFIGFLLAIALSTLITRPLVKMVDAVEKISQGDWKQRANVFSRDEVGALATAFNSMVSNLELAYDNVRESEKNYRNLFDLIPHPMWVFDRNTLAFLEVNEAAILHYGYSRNEFLAMTIKDMRPSEEIPRLLDDLREQPTGFHKPETWKHKKKDGTVVEVEITSHSLPFADKNATIVVASDITERRRAEESLSYERNMLRTMIDNIPDRIYVKDAQCRFLVNNVAHMRALGANSFEEVIGKTDFDYRSKDLATQYYHDDQEVITLGLSLNREEPSILPTGEKLWLSSTKVPLRDRTGAVVGIVGISRDITERKQAEEALQHERILLRTLIDNIPDAIYVKDLACRKVVANVADLHNMGMQTEAEVLGKDDYDFFPRELADAFFADDQSVLHTGQPVINREEYVVDVDGGKRWLLTSKLPLRDEQGQIVGLIGVGRDITEHRRAEEALRASEAQLSEALKISRLGYWERDFLNDEFTFNDQFYDLLHTTAEREGGYTMPTAQYVQRFIHPEDALVVAREGQLATETTDPNFSRQFDHRIIYADGEVGYVTVRYRVLKDAHGRTIKTFGVNQDITERKRAEEYLRRATEEMHAIFWRSIVTKADDETTGAGGFVWNTEYLNLDAIHKFLPLSGESGKAYDEFYKSRLEEDRLAMDRQSADALRRGVEGYSQEFRIRDANGILHWMSEDARIQRLSDTQFEVIGFITDITERKRAEEYLRRATEEMHAIFWRATVTKTDDETTGAGGFVWNTEYLNLEAIHKFLPLSEEPRKAYDEFYRSWLKEDRLAMDRHSADVLRQGAEGYSQEFRIRDANGILHWMSEDARIQRLSDTQFEVIGLITDITERKRIEEKQIELIHELESANKELNDFAYIISHDLKAPLRAIGSLVDWLCADYGEKLGEEGNEMLKVLLGRTKRMHDLIEGVLRYSRIGRTKENMTELALDKLVPEIVEMIDPPKHIDVKIQHPLPIIMGETTRVQQVFQNLLSNAIKFMDKPHGEIQIGCERENGHWKFSVADNGPGIEERHHEKVFQIFQTLSARDDFESTGIGLTIVKKIVENYDGKIWLESKVGSGTVFYFTFPALVNN